VTDERDAVLGELVETVELMQAQIADLRGRVLAGSARSSPVRGGQPPTLSLDDLDEWVAWLIETYELEEEIPDCWREHGAMVEEISALSAAHAGAVDPFESRPVDRLLWQESLLRSLQRLRDWDRRRCRSRGHHWRSAESVLIDR
jgi:hypothetical protein